ncbi:peptidase S64, partial [Nadsonia fulvescens var. elongata DSM 6958]
VSVNKYPSLANTIKIVLHFHDNLLSHHCHSRTRGQMLRLFCLLGTRLKLLSVTSNCALAYPRNFAFGSVAEFDSQAVVLSIMDSIASAESSAITDQEGSFIAPVLRGLGPQFAVLTITFGFPEPSQDHYDVVTSLTKLMPDIHLYCQKNSISVCANGVSNSSRAYFKPPFREPLDDKCPPISLSLSVQNAQTTSGTLGGYIYPKINPRKKELADHARFTYAMTCAHVCMTSRPRDSSENNYSAISVPSSVLINMFKRALQGEVKKYPPTSEVYRAYNGAVKGLDEKYPMPDNEGKYNPSCNQPKDTFGQVVWGERTVINGSISDIAIIRCSPNITCRNYLGDDICFSEYDPALMFENLHVKHIEQKIISGMHVFKYGSTSKYTAGIFNGPKIVYWADGKIQSSEFIVRSTSSPMFATGGDSGSWILHKRDTGPGLSVLGMLHSYDGEHKEFGLFTPMTQILDRLAEITGNKWGI